MTPLYPRPPWKPYECIVTRRQRLANCIGYIVLALMAPGALVFWLSCWVGAEK